MEVCLQSNIKIELKTNIYEKQYQGVNFKIKVKYYFMLVKSFVKKYKKSFREAMKNRSIFKLSIST